MAFTYCSGCGEKIDDNARCCPHCGQAKGADSGRREDPRANSYGDSGQNNYGGYRDPYSQGGYDQNGYGQNGYGPNGYGQNNRGGYQPWVTPNQSYPPRGDGKKRKISVGHMIFAIITLCFSPLFGFLALYNAIIAAQQPNDALEEKKKTSCIIFCTVGICISFLLNALIVWMTWSGWLV